MTVCDRVLFTLNKEFFRYCEKPSFWGKNHFFFFFWGGGGGGGGELVPVFLRIFWSGVVGAIDTFVAEHVANMLS